MIKNTFLGFGLGIILVGVMASASAQKVYWGTNGGDIRRIDIDGMNEELLVSGQSGFKDIEVDEDGGKIYWINSSTIRRSNLDGTGQEDLVTGAVPQGLALDLEDGKIYFTDNETAIRRANLDGSNVELVTTTFTRGGTGPTIIDVDTVANKIYYGVGDGSRIDRMNFDGTGLENLFTGGDMFEIRVDEINSKLYISQLGIKVSELDGTNQSTIISTEVGFYFDIDPSGEFLFYQFSPSGMGIDQDFIRSDLNGASPLTLIEGGFSPEAIAFPEPAPAEPILTTWVDFAFGPGGDGSESNPYNTLALGLANVAVGGTINVKGDTATSATAETPTISQDVTVQAINGTVTIGTVTRRAADSSRFGFVSRGPKRE